MRSLLLVMVSLIILSGCDKESEGEKGIPMSYFDNKLHFQLQDINGNDLLDTSVLGHYKVSDIEITNIPESQKTSALVPKTSVYVEIRKNTEDDYYYAELGLIMPEKVGEKELVAIETSNGEVKAWVSETEATQTNVRLRDSNVNVFKAIYKTTQIDIPDMYGGNSTVVTRIWHNDRLIFERGEDSREWSAPIIIVDVEK